jgi:periplasmic divalent cation tolerance protein
MDPYVVVYVVAGSEQEALTIARTLVEERLAACANLLPQIRSVYRWKGQICDEFECYLIIKTRQSLFQTLKDRVEALHSYEVPEIIALPVVEGLDSYLKWVHEETRSSSPE